MDALERAKAHGNLAQQRLHNQRLAGTPVATPEEVVARLGAVQAQDYPAALWALGLRTRDATAAMVEAACTAGTILRTHVMRPTWHFVAPADIRWLLALTAPRVKALLAYYDRKLEVDATLLARSTAVLIQALQGGRQLTRTELGARLQHAGIATTNLQRLGQLMMHAELDGLLCSGARRGKQFTYALLDERVPPAPALTREEALAALTRRYFTGHGPATLKDFGWWSGLAAADVKAGLDMVQSQLVPAVVAGQTYWQAAPLPTVSDPAPTVYLLPNFDEYGVGYSDRSAIVDPTRTGAVDPKRPIYLGQMLVLGGQIVGSWQRVVGAGTVMVTKQTHTPFSAAETAAFAAAAQRYGAFLGLPVHLA